MKPNMENPNVSKIRIDNQDIFFDRELSWLDFNIRVLEEAKDQTNPLLERLKYLCITESNLDEFYMVRVAGLKNQIKDGNDVKSLNGMRISQIMKHLSKKVVYIMEEQYRILINHILPELKENGIVIIENPQELKEEEIAFIKHYYKEEVSSILTPLAIDPTHPFPHILNKTLNLAITLTVPESPKKDSNLKRISLAVVQVPSVLPRFLELPSNGSDRRFFPLEGIIKLHLSDLFYGMAVKEIHAFKITRDSDLAIEEDEQNDLLTSVKKELRNRIWGGAVKLDVHFDAIGKVKDTLQELIDVKDHETFDIPYLLNINDLMYFYNLNNTSQLKFTYSQTKNILDSENLDKIFQRIRKEDILLHHPYDSFKVLENMLKFASEDPKTLAIKMTLYRTSKDSPIIQYLKQAAENGKQVTVLVELKARFDEERNIQWAMRLEDSGVHVVYGLAGLKIHCKMLLIVRREVDKLKRYVHLSTGNYNSTTAKYYTDLSLFTDDEDITEDSGVVFNALTSSATIPRLKKLSAAPLYLRDDILALIESETNNAKAGKQASIILKMNSLVDPDVILSLYRASNAGIQIELIVRGICCLVPGIKGISENITVRSIIGRYLEHSRIYIFNNDGNPKIYLTSADSMPRNFFKRVEVMFPILDEKNKQRVFEIINTILKDNVKARYLYSDGKYLKKTLTENEQPFESQIELVDV